MKHKSALFLVSFLLGCNFAFAQQTIIQDTASFITTSDGVRLFVKEKGTGPVCIFVHGGPGA